MYRSVIISRLLISLALVVVSVGLASAQDRRQNASGEFHFYVLALSWSPSFCEAAAERGNSGRRRSSANGPIPSWFTACGRNMSAAFPNIASGLRRGSTATSSPRCWT